MRPTGRIPLLICPTARRRHSKGCETTTPPLAPHLFSKKKKNHCSNKLKTQGSYRPSRHGLDEQMFGARQQVLRGAKRLTNRMASETGRVMKRCTQCHGPLGLGVRFRNVWNGRWWLHVRYCSSHCEALHELERYNVRTKCWRHIIARSSPQK